MSTILIAILIVVYTMQSLLCKKYSEYYPGEEATSSPVFTAVSGMVVFVFSYALTGFCFEASALTIILGIINGLALFGYNVSMIRASKNGPYSIVMVFMIAGGIILPILSASIGFHEQVSIGRWISILVLIAAVYMTSKKTEDTGFLNKKVFWLGCFGLAVFNGTYGALLAIQQKVTSTAEKEEMVAVTYLTAMIISGLALIISQENKTLAAFKQTKKSGIYLICCSFIVAIAINLIVFILPLVNLTILYTFDNSGVFLMSVLISRVFFKEKMTVFNWIGCGVMCLALVGVSVL